MFSWLRQRCAIRVFMLRTLQRHAQSRRFVNMVEVNVKPLEAGYNGPQKAL